MEKCMVCLNDTKSLIYDGTCREGICKTCIKGIKDDKCPNCREIYPWTSSTEFDHQEFTEMVDDPREVDLLIIESLRREIVYLTELLNRANIAIKCESCGDEFTDIYTRRNRELDDLCNNCYEYQIEYEDYFQEEPAL